MKKEINEYIQRISFRSLSFFSFSFISHLTFNVRYRRAIIQRVDHRSIEMSRDLTTLMCPWQSHDSEGSRDSSELANRDSVSQSSSGDNATRREDIKKTMTADRTSGLQTANSKTSDSKSRVRDTTSELPPVPQIREGVDMRTRAYKQVILNAYQSERRVPREVLGRAPQGAGGRIRGRRVAGVMDRVVFTTTSLLYLHVMVIETEEE